MQERTLSIIKPDGVARGLIGEVIKRFEQAGFKIVGMKMVHMSKEQAEGFYVAHRGRSYFEGLTEFMSSGPALVMVLEGESAISRLREVMGATNPANAAPGTIRKLYASNIEHNAVHGSDAPETAAYEIGYFFAGVDLV